MLHIKHSWKQANYCENLKCVSAKAARKYAETKEENYDADFNVN